MISLTGSPAPVTGVAALGGLLDADSSEFAASIGNWTNVGGTLTWESGTPLLTSDMLGAAQLVTTADGQYMTCPVPGKFLAGVTYELLIALRIAEPVTSVFGEADIWFGMYGTDTSALSITAVPSDYNLYALVWTPTATRTGVTIRVTRTAGENPNTWRIGWVQVARRSMKRGDAIVIATPPRTNATNARNGMALMAIATQGQLNLSPQALPYDGLRFRNEGDVQISVVGGDSAVYTGSLTYKVAGMYQEHPNNGRFAAGGAGLNFEVGLDYLGFSIFQEDTTVIGLASETAAGIDVELQDRGSHHWIARTAYGTRRLNLTDLMQSPLTAVDDLVLGGSASFTATLRDTPASGVMFFGNSAASIALLGKAVVSTEGPVSGSVTVNYDFWISHSNFGGGGSMTTTTHLRRTNVSGAILATDTYTASTDSVAGHSHHWTGSYVDASPTDGIYVIETITDGAVIYADTYVLTATGTQVGVPTRVAVGAVRQVLSVDPSDSHAKWMNLPLKKLAGQTINATATTIAHGLGTTPSIVIISPRSNATFWESSVADATNVYIQASTGSSTADIYVAP